MIGLIRPIRLILLALLLGSASYAQDDVRYEYMLDDKTEMTLSPSAQIAKGWAMELRQYGAPTESVVFSLNVDLKPKADGVFEYKSGLEMTARAVHLTGTPGDREKPVEVTTRNLTYPDTKPLRIHGFFKRVEPEYLEARTKERYLAADAALSEFINKLAFEIGKNAEPKLREAQAERVKWRDQLALVAVGGPNQPKAGPGYWQTLYQATLDSLAFFRSYTGRTADKALPGAYYAANGASLSLEMPPEGGMKFTVTIPLAPIAFGPDGESRAETDPPLTGQIAGVAKYFITRATFKGPPTKTAAGVTREPAELVFNLRGHIVHIDAKNTEAYAGPDLYFSGDFYKMVPPPPRK